MTAHSALRPRVGTDGADLRAGPRAGEHYRPDPTSTRELSRFATAAHGRVFGEDDLDGLANTIRGEAGSTPVTTDVLGYARVALAPWFILAGIIPLAFLIYLRNF